MSVTYIWLISGVALMVIDAVGIPGVGVMFAGLGAVTAGIAVNLALVGDTSYVSQFIIFFASTAVWAVALWKPIQKFRLKHPHPGYNNIVGETGYVGSSGLSKTGGGEVTWSGTIMKAQLIHHASVDTLEAGTPVTIVEVSGTTLMVKPK